MTRLRLFALSLFALYIIWGSTYLAIRIGLESFPPFVMAAMRFFVIGSIAGRYITAAESALYVEGMNVVRNWRSSCVAGEM